MGRKQKLTLRKNNRKNSKSEKSDHRYSKVSEKGNANKKHFVNSTGPTNEFPDPLPVDRVLPTQESVRKPPTKRKLNAPEENSEVGGAQDVVDEVQGVEPHHQHEKQISYSDRQTHNVKPEAMSSLVDKDTFQDSQSKIEIVTNKKREFQLSSEPNACRHLQPIEGSACSDGKGPLSICPVSATTSEQVLESQRPVSLKSAPVNIVQQPVYFLLPNQGSVVKTSEEKTAAQMKYDLAEKEIATLQQKLENLQKQIVGKKWSVDRIKFNDEKTRIYTGLPSWSAFMSLFSMVEQDVTEVKCVYHDPMDTDDQYDLTLSDELFAVLVTLKLGLYREEVSDCFAIKLEKFEEIFSVWVSCLFNKLEQWGTRISTLKKVTDRVVPSIVQNTSNLKIILCWLKLTFKLSSPPNCEVKESVYKILTGLNPQGNFIFSSGIWVLKAEGSMVAVTSGILELLDDGDTIIVPSDIDIDFAIHSKSIKSITLPYDKGEVIRTADEQTQSVYSFIQQSMDRLKGFKIMDKIIPVELLENSHELVSVCSRLCNCHNS
ncbi:hypothetical protein ScPMuIL_011030 [Solemya velum]